MSSPRSDTSSPFVPRRERRHSGGAAVDVSDRQLRPRPFLRTPSQASEQETAVWRAARVFEEYKESVDSANQLQSSLRDRSEETLRREDFRTHLSQGNPLKRKASALKVISEERYGGKLTPKEVKEALKGQRTTASAVVRQISNKFEERADPDPFEFQLSPPSPPSPPLESRPPSPFLFFDEEVETRAPGYYPPGPGELFGTIVEDPEAYPPTFAHPPESENIFEIDFSDIQLDPVYRAPINSQGYVAAEAEQSDSEGSQEQADQEYISSVDSQENEGEAESVSENSSPAATPVPVEPVTENISSNSPATAESEIVWSNSPIVSIPEDISQFSSPPKEKKRKRYSLSPLIHRDERE
jgi:hypothetical protein